MRGSRGGVAVVVGLVAAALVGCGQDVPPAGQDVPRPTPPAASPTAMLPADGPVRAVGTVLDDGAGPALCLGGVAQSLPPQCAGPPVTGWDWGDHPDHESAGGVQWGQYTMDGTWDGTAFTPTDVRGTVAGDAPADDLAEHFAAPCPEPDGGWQAVDPATTSRSSLSTARQVADALPHEVLTWTDQAANPAWQAYVDGDSSEEVRRRLDDPDLTVLVVTVTGDAEGAEAAVREVWGGALCVTRVANSAALLRRVQGDLLDLPGFLGSSAGSTSNTLELAVVNDDGSIQAWVDEEYGPGVVTVTSALVPVG